MPEDVVIAQPCLRSGAEWEERLLKGAWRAAYRLPGIRGVAVRTAPWFDAYYRVL